MQFSFEAGVAALKRFIGREGDGAYHANVHDPLHAAFRAKATVHAGPIGLPMMWGAARAKLETLSNETRTAQAVAYVQVPFCSTRCLYCMFYQNPFSEAASARYAARLAGEFALWADRRIQAKGEGGDISALYFGGGTPSALAPSDIEKVVGAARRHLPLSPDCEITLEGRVHDMTPERLDAAARAGVNRLSIGVQTFNGDIRRAMMRLDGRPEILAALERAARYPEFAVVIDLIYGFPWQTAEVWEDDLETACSLPIDGIDCYQLNVFAKSPLAKRINAGAIPPAATLAEAADRFARADAVLGSDSRWTRISNTHWQRTPKERNRYNSLAKTACDCLAFGSGAGGRIAGHTFMTERRLAAWEKRLDEGEKPVFALLKPTANWHLMRTVASAVEQGPFSLKAIGEAFDVSLDALAEPLLSQWISAGLLTKSGDLYSPTTAGRFWHVTMAQFLVSSLTKKLSKDASGLPAQAFESVYRPVEEADRSRSE